MLAYRAAATLAEWLTNVVPARATSKVARAFAGRRHLLDRYEQWGVSGRDPSRPLVWFHAPSVGEGLMALPLIRQLRTELPETQIVYTFFSPSAEPFSGTLDVDFAAYLPFDTPGAAERALRALRPTALVFSKLDVWPTLVRHAHRHGVRTGVVSASMSARSSRRRGVGAAFTREAYATLEAVGAAGEDDARHLVEAGVRPERVRVTGDTRYDQAWARAHGEHELRRHGALIDALRSDRVARDRITQDRITQDRITLVAGSTWPADERHLLPAWRQVTSEVPGARFIIAPHEIHRRTLGSVERWATRSGLLCTRLSTLEATVAGTRAPEPRTAAWDVLLVDRIGVLADLYAVADIAYVGGGFHRAGLHSVVEPAVFHVPVLFGPQHDSSRDAGLLLRGGGAHAVADETTLAQQLLTLVRHAERRQTMAVALREIVSGELGATRRSFAIVRELLGAV